MANLTRLRNRGGWLNRREVSQEEHELIDEMRPRTLDGEGGGTVSPSSPIILGGAAIKTSVSAVDDDDFTTLKDVNDSLTARTGTAGTLEWLTYQAEGMAYADQTADFGAGLGYMSMRWGNDGLKLYVLTLTTGLLYSFSCSVAYTMATAVYDSVALDVTSEEVEPRDLTLSADGTKIFVVGTDSDAVHLYELSAPWDLSTVSNPGVSFSVASQDTGPHGMKWNNDGTGFYIAGNQNDTIFQYICSTPYDITTAFYSGLSSDVSAQDGTIRAVDFNDDGTLMYVLGAANHRLYQYRLNTAFKMGGHSLEYTIPINLETTTPSAMEWNGDGSQLIIAQDEQYMFLYYTSRMVLPD